ncbi:ATP-dependent RNA helicase DBP3 [Trachymyrmex zeteki]|uniref:RNA helicase n=1 Tax=Mycetomoellerius zeteki TaxID=64791 RepID=A0A151X6S3_9HYME|nr:ATP-dependent RNA helicase DBP3 [Trachymyrmex zeteki]
MRAYEVEKHTETLCMIEEKLLNFMKTNEFLKKKSNTKDTKIGDMILVQDSFKAEKKLPSCICRGLITCIKKECGISYIILLVDHGISIELTRDKFHVLPKNLIPDEYLTKTVGVYDIIPICMRKSTILNGCNTIAIVAEKWTEKAVQFTKHLLSACKIVYFDHLITNKSNGIEYGEFYFIIDNVVMSLSEALFLNYHAVYIEGGIEKILVQSSMDCDVLNDITDLRYPKGIHQGWDESIKSSRPRKLQSYIWPAINNGLNVVAIGSTQCGKTSGCVMAVCGQIALRLHEICSATQPLALILCASSFEVISVQSLCESFLRSFSNIKCVAAFNGKSDRSIAAMIHNGCQILVTTPRYLVRFLNKNKGSLLFDRLSYLILDNADVILDKYYNSVGELFKKHKIIENREPQEGNKPILQIIVSATNWTPEIKKFVHLVMYNPYICIASFIEAVVFKSISLKLYSVNIGYKHKKIVDLLSKNEYLTMRTAIVCTNAEEAEDLNTFLILTKKTLLIHDKMKSSAIREYMQNMGEIQNYYGNIENRKMSTSTNVGDICVLEETIDTFKRVQIICIRYDKVYSEDEKFVNVRCIDSGIVHEHINVRKLMHIPKKLLDLPTHVVEIFLANLVPWDEEYMWNHYTNEQVHKWFSENFDERSYIIGEVRLHLGNTIWLDDLKIGTKLIGHPDLIGSSLKKELCHGSFSIVNNNHLSNLFKFCRNSGMTEINGHNLNATDK